MVTFVSAQIFVNLIFFFLFLSITSSSTPSDLPTLATPPTECSVDNRDCSCADRFFKSCQEPVAFDQVKVVNMEECKLQCDAFGSVGACDWFIFDHMEDTGINCYLFADESMVDYVASCNMAGAALRNEDGECLNGFDPHLWHLCDMDWMCNGCASCEADPCTAVMETECTMTTVPTVAAHHAADGPNFDACRTFTASQGTSNPTTFFVFDKLEELCLGYESGRRVCKYVVAAQTVDMAVIESCLA